MTLDPAFLCLSPGSAAPHEIPRRLVIDELARTLHWRRDKYPARVSKGWMGAIAADEEIDMMAAIHADHETSIFLDRWAANGQRDEDLRAWKEVCTRAAGMIAPFGWSGLIDCLRREILARRESYPKRVEKGQMDAAVARHQLERIEAAHARYWIHAVHFWPDALGPWRDSAGNGAAWPPDLFEPWQAALRAHRARFAPGPDNHRGTYAAPPAEPVNEQQQEMIL